MADEELSPQEAPMDDEISGDELAALLGSLEPEIPAAASAPPLSSPPAAKPASVTPVVAGEGMEDEISADELEALGIVVSKGPPPPAPKLVPAPPPPPVAAPLPPPKVATPANAGIEPKLPQLTAEDDIAPDAGLGLLMDVPLRVSIELGRISMTLQQVLSLGRGSIVELERLAGEPVDILVNDKLIGRGEVVVIDEYFGVKISELIEPKGQG